jgi:hypothetical protein
MAPVRCALSQVTAKALEKWIAACGKKRNAVALAAVIRWVRQLSRLLKLWVAESELDPAEYSVESLQRIKALDILKGTGDLQAVRALLSNARIESTARYLGLKIKATRSRFVEPSISDGISDPPAHADRPGTPSGTPQ